MRHVLPVLVVCLLVAGSAASAVQRRSNVAGTWQVWVDVGDTHATPIVVLQQKGGVLTGTITQPRGQQKLTGTIEGNDAVFAFEAVRDGRTVTGVYRGKVESRTKMTGTVEFTGALTGAGTWVATKK
jgi:hypothetical protein